jgi:hypothetical protein
MAPVYHYNYALKFEFVGHLFLAYEIGGFLVGVLILWFYGL